MVNFRQIFLPNKFDFELYKVFFHGKNGPKLPDFGEKKKT